MGNQACIYCLSPDLVVEYFQDQSLLLLAMQDTILTVNRAAAELLELFQVTIEERYFSAEDLSALLTQHYDIN